MSTDEAEEIVLLDDGEHSPTALGECHRLEVIEFVDEVPIESFH